MFSSDPGKGDEVTASAMNVTKIVSIFVALCAGLTQGLSVIDAVKLQPTQMVTIWLVVAALIVALGITDMACRTYATTHRAGAKEETFVAPPEVDVTVDGHVKKADWIGWVDEKQGPLAHVRFAGDKEDSWVLLNSVKLHA
jgi:hypothetical protein